MFENLPRKKVIMDSRGRLTVPEYMRDAAGFPKGESSFVTVEAYPGLKDCRTIIIKRE